MATTLAVAPLMPAVDARLCLSLDDLIKERKKENKQKKRESVKQETKPAPQDAKKSKAKAQAEQRKAVMNKNRGLPAPKQTTESSGKQQKKPQQRQKKKKTTKAAAPVQQSAGPSKHQNKKTKNAPHANGSQLSNGQTKKKKTTTTTTVVEHKKVDNKKMAKPQPTLSPKRQQNKNQRMAPSSPKQNREVTKPRNGVKLTITLKRSRGDVRRMKKQQQQQKKQQRSVVVKPRVMKALLPGKTQPKTKKILAQHIVKKVKTSRKQQAASKSSRQGQFIVRKPVVVRRVKSERR